jgi:hypothetical protein
MSTQPLPATAPEYKLDVKDKEESINAEVRPVGDGGIITASQIEPGFEVDEKENRRLLRKIDWHLMPLMCVVYGLQFVSGPQGKGVLRKAVAC